MKSLNHHPIDRTPANLNVRKNRLPSMMTKLMFLEGAEVLAKLRGVKVKEVLAAYAKALRESRVTGHGSAVNRLPGREDAPGSRATGFSLASYG